MEQLDVELNLANNPQAQGRVERMSGMLQDRLVKALRQAGMSDLSAANACLERTYLPELNRGFIAARRGDPASRRVDGCAASVVGLAC